MKVGLIGFGKTGKAVASVLLQHPELKLEWVLKKRATLDQRSAAEFLGVESDEAGIIFSSATKPFAELLLEHPVEVIIDFSSSEGIFSYGEIASSKGIKIISAVSHYSPEELTFLKKLAQKTAVFWSPNITLGVNFLLFAAKLLKKIAPSVDVEIVEEHFKGKNGVSGTAMKIAEALDMDKAGINSIRAGGIVGKHEVIFGFPFQTIRLVHESISREAFGNGVIFAAQNIKDKEQGFYNFEDILMPYFSMQ